MNLKKEYIGKVIFYFLSIGIFLAFIGSQIIFLFKNGAFTSPIFFFLDSTTQPIFIKHILYTLIIIGSTFVMLCLLRNIAWSDTFDRLVVVFGVLLIIPTYYLYYLGNGMYIDCILDEKVILVLKGIGIGILLFYFISRRTKEISVRTLLGISIITGIICFMREMRWWANTIVYNGSDKLFNGIHYECNISVLYELLLILIVIPCCFLFFKNLKKKERYDDYHCLDGSILFVLINLLVLVALAGIVRFAEEPMEINKLGNEIGKDIVCLAISMALQIGLVAYLNKIKKQKFILGLLGTMIGISYVHYFQWHAYLVDKILMLQPGDLMVRFFSNMQVYLSPITVAVVLILIIKERENKATTKIMSWKEVGIISCSNFIGYLVQMIFTRWWENNTSYLISQGGGILEFTSYGTWTLIILLALLISLCILCRLMVGKQIISRKKIAETVMDTTFFACILVAACIKEYHHYAETEATGIKDIGSLDKVKCLTVNAGLSLLIALAVYIIIRLIGKQRKIWVDLLVGALCIGVLCLNDKSIMLLNKWQHIASWSDTLCVIEALLRAVAIAYMIYIASRGLKKQLTAKQLAFIVGGLNWLSLCKYTMGRTHFSQHVSFIRSWYDPSVYLATIYFDYYGLILAIGLLPIYIALKEICFGKKVVWKSIQKIER